MIAAPPASPLGPVALLSAQAGFVGAKRGVLATTDGGATWRRVLSTGRPVSEVQFPQVRNGFAVTSRALRSTRDGGARWRRVEVGAALASVDFLGPHRGWGMAARGGHRHGLVRRTADGGAHWSSLGVRADGVCRSSRSTGWLGRGTRVYRTTDAGRSWTRVFTVPTGGNGPAPRTTVHCVDARHAWALTAGGGAAGGSTGYAVWSTADGGRRWHARLAQFMPTPHQVPHIDSYPGPFDVVSNRVAAFLGFCPACGHGTLSLTITHDGGRHWAHHRVGLPPALPRADGLMFAGGRRGWVAETVPAAPTRIAATADGGRSWRRVR